MTVLDRWNEAWEDSVVRLVPDKDGVLEGAEQWDREMIRRAGGPGKIRNEAQYNKLMETLGEWGYCVECPMEVEV